MELLRDLKTYIVNEGVVQADIVYRDAMPDTPDTAVALYAYEGNMPMPQIAGANRPVQVVVRAKSATEAHELSSKIHRSLITEEGIIYLTADRWSTINLRQVPFKLKTDEAGRVYYCFNVYFTTYIG